VYVYLGYYLDFFQKKKNNHVLHEENKILCLVKKKKNIHAGAAANCRCQLIWTNIGDIIA
jgi:hypothetical protein